MGNLIGSDWYYKTVYKMGELKVMRTYQVANHLGIKTRQALILMKQMESAGVVSRGKFSYKNCISWQLTEEG